MSEIQKARIGILTLVFMITFSLGTLPTTWQVRLFVWIAGIALASALVSYWRHQFLDKMQKVRCGSIQDELNAEREAPAVNYWLPTFIRNATRALDETRKMLQREIAERRRQRRRGEIVK